jgi:hypothetical protein
MRSLRLTSLASLRKKMVSAPKPPLFAPFSSLLWVVLSLFQLLWLFAPPATATAVVPTTITIYYVAMSLLVHGRCIYLRPSPPAPQHLSSSTTAAGVIVNIVVVVLIVVNVGTVIVVHRCCHPPPPLPLPSSLSTAATFSSISDCHHGVVCCSVPPAAAVVV